MTIYHHIEEMNNVTWRFHKIFKGTYIDWDQKKTEVEASTFVRKDIFKINTNVNGMQKYFMKNNLYVCQNKGSTNGIRSIDAKIVKIHVEKIFKTKLSRRYAL